jgi:hypothetical protein
MKWLKKLNENKLGRRGNAWFTTIIAVGIGIVTLVVLAIMLGALKTGLVANSLEANITQSGLDFLKGATSQLSTAGTVVGVALILVVMGLVGFGVYSGVQKMRGGR